MKEKDNVTIESIKEQQKSQNRRAWVLYIVLLFCRIALSPFLPGYIHPDEFFQGGQELWFGCPPFTPWEFESQNALRSIVPPTLMTWIPLQLYALLTQRSNVYSLTGREILVIPRVCCAILSVFTVDLPIWLMTRRKKAAPPPTVLVVASAWPMFLLLNRPFTNSLETMLLALLLLVSTSVRRGLVSDLLCGTLCATGLFTRFTFVFVAIPTMMLYLRDMMSSLSISKVVRGIVIMAIGFLGTAACIVSADASYYNHERTDASWTSYMTPLNALLYNSKVENLKQHGLHPRWTHAAVNMLLLFGPIAIMFYVTLAGSILSFVSSSEKSPDNDESQPSKDDSRIQTTCTWTIVSGLGLLSMAPHQEPRFLLPLLVPLVIVSQPFFQSTWVRRVWVVFNVIFLLFYGVLHQGGVIPSLAAASTLTSEGETPRAIFYFHTYMPPTFASRVRTGGNDSESCLAADTGDGDSDNYCSTETLGCANVPIIDLKGASCETLLSALHEHISCGDRDADSGENGSGGVYLVSSPLSMGTVVIGAEECELGESFSCRHVQSLRPHVTTEDFPPFDGSIGSFLSNLNLSYYEVACR